MKGSKLIGTCRGNALISAMLLIGQTSVHAVPQVLVLEDCEVSAETEKGADSDTVTLGQIDPPGDGAISSMAFDGSVDPLVIDGWLNAMWRIDIRDASVTETFPLSQPGTPRALTFDPNSGVYYLIERISGPNDFLGTVDPLTGLVSTIGFSGSFNFVDIDFDPTTGVLWLVEDCANPPWCSHYGGARIGTIDPATGSYTVVAGFTRAIGQATALAIDENGMIFVATSSRTGADKIYEIDPFSGDATFVRDVGLVRDALLEDIDFDPSTGVLYGVEERRSFPEWTWHLVQLTSRPAIVVSLDIKPDSFPNSINPYSRGVIPVAILGSDTLDVADVDVMTLAFGPNGAAITHFDGHLEDANFDGIMDLVVHFETRDTGIVCGDESATLTGETIDGQPLEGSDSIHTVGCRGGRRSLFDRPGEDRLIQSRGGDATTPQRK